MLVLPLKVLLKNKFGKKRKKQGMIMAERHSSKKFGTGKVNMVKKLFINSRDLVFPSIGIDLLLLLMILGLKLSQNHLLKCSRKNSFIEIQDLSIGAVL